MGKVSLPIILLVYFGITVSTLLFWKANNLNVITGDEPHYLVMANGIARHATLEQSVPYREEFRSNTVSPDGPLGPKNAEPNPQNTPALIRGPHGLFNVHDVGLPALLALPFLIGGVVGAKLFMALCGALVIVCVWAFTEALSLEGTGRFWAVFACCISMPLIPAALEIYPEVVAGLLSLVGLYGFFTAARRQSLAAELALAAAVAFLPWLQIKFAATSAILILAIALKIYFETKSYRRIGALLTVAAFSAAALAAYNQYAFGHISGPYSADVLQLNATSLMSFLGLGFDQNQGFLLINPLYLAGVFAIGALYRLDRWFAVLWTLVFLSLIGPNALHTNVYGGYSFSGRFGWAGAVVFLIPAVYGLGLLAKARLRLFSVLIALGIGLQLYCFYALTFGRAYLYNKPPGTWPDVYTIFYYPVQRWLPMFYDSAWAYRYAPNGAWLCAILAILIAGFRGRDWPRRSAGLVAASLGALIFGAGLARPPGSSQTTFPASTLASDLGTIVGSARVARPGIDPPGFLDRGPYMPFHRGMYEVFMDYSSAGYDAPGSFDIFDDTTGKTLHAETLLGTGGSVRQIRVQFVLSNWNDHILEFRTTWNGAIETKVYAIRAREMPTRLAMAR